MHHVAASQTETVRAQVVMQEARALEDKHLASRRKRLVAFAIDVWGAVIVAFLLLSPLALVSPVFYENAATVVWLTYFLLRDSIPGQSLGKRLLGLREIQEDSGMSCTWLISIWRNIFHLLFFIHALFVLGDDRMRLGDLLAGTVVVKDCS